MNCTTVATISHNDRIVLTGSCEDVVFGCREQGRG